MRSSILRINVIMLSSMFLVALGGSAAFAQQSGATNSPQTIQQRKQNQQDRVANGIDSGQLTAGESKRLERKEAGINREEHAMRQQDNGKLTLADRAALDRQQDHFSRQIYADTHNAATAHYGSGAIGQRRENQQDRIANGLRSGQMTSGEAARSERQQQGLNREVSGMRQANGGRLTRGERALVTRQQNRTSRQIYNRQHNGRSRY